jgi:WS/DGAT/MGAT family acyltransferase
MRIDRLSNLDRLMIGASRTWPQDIGALAILDGTELLDPAGHLRIEALRQSIESRLHLVPRFRQLIFTPGRLQGGPLWIDDPDFDLNEHVREHTLPSPGGERQMLDAVEQLRKRRLDPGRPLWEMWFLTGLPGDRVGLYVRIHHTVADGIAAMTTVAAFLDTSVDLPTGPAVSWTPEPAPSSRDLFTDHLTRRLGSLVSLFTALLHPGATVRRMRTAWPAIRELVAESPSTKTSLDQMVGLDRHLALIRERLDVAKAVGHTHGATVNDILLAATAGGLRALLQSRGEAVVGTTLRAYAPVSLRGERHRPQQGNLIAQMAIPLRLGEADPFRRLRQIANETSERKARARTSLGVLIHGRITRRIMLIAVMRQRVNVATASIPGPTEPLYLLGARLLEVFPILPLIANEPLAVGALSYAGALHIGIAADRDAIPDIEVFTAGVGAELEALGAPPRPAENLLMSGRQSNNEGSE